MGLNFAHVVLTGTRSPMATLKYASEAGPIFYFGVYSPSSSWPRAAGLFMFCRYNALRCTYEPVYIGQCDDFGARSDWHGRWPDAEGIGATRVMLVSVPLQADRDRLEAILVRELQPKLNQLVRFDFD
jgi:hypothetical protein